METFCYQLTQVHLAKWPLKWRKRDTNVENRIDATTCLGVTGTMVLTAILFVFLECFSSILQVWPDLPKEKLWGWLEQSFCGQVFLLLSNQWCQSTGRVGKGKGTYT